MNALQKKHREAERGQRCGRKKKRKIGAAIKCLTGTVTQGIGYLVFITKLRLSQFHPALGQPLSLFLSLSLSSSPLSYLIAPSFSQSTPSSPSLSILPYRHRSSHSTPVFVEEPVKVPPAAVQTLMAPRCVCAYGRPPMFPVDFVLAIITAQCFHYCHHGIKERKGRERKRDGICGEMKRKNPGTDIEKSHVDNNPL